MQIILLTFQGPPERFHWTVIDAPSNTRHALDHFVVIQKFLKAQGGVLVASVAMKHGAASRCCLQAQFQRLEYKGIVIRTPYYIGDDGFIMKVENSAQIRFLAIAVLEFRYIGEPLFIRCIGMELAV